MLLFLFLFWKIFVSWSKFVARVHITHSIKFWQVIEGNHHESRTEIEQTMLPLLVYVSREKRPSQPHHFKAGALNALV